MSPVQRCILGWIARPLLRHLSDVLEARAREWQEKADTAGRETSSRGRLLDKEREAYYLGLASGYRASAALLRLTAEGAGG